MARRHIPADHPPFSALPVRLLTVGGADERVAVHVAGRLGSGRMPLLCLAGYTRNMADFSDFVVMAQRLLGADWPLILLDLRGRGRAADRPRVDDYSTVADARDVAEISRALGLERVVVVGQGHGGQVAMALAALRPLLIAAAVLIDAGPAAEPRSLIRLRSNLEAILASRGAAGLTIMLRRMLSADYPGLPPEALDRLALRSQWVDERGRVRLLFDHALVDKLKSFDHDDVLVPQWPLFALLASRPLLLVQSELTDQVSPQLLAEMQSRAPAAQILAIAGQGSPPLLDSEEAVAPIVAFLRDVQSADSTRRR